jgi:Uncharacterized alpha/beta hydrolase domain (DUF2235)
VKEKSEIKRRQVGVRFIGVWDTVAAYGPPIEELTEHARRSGRVTVHTNELEIIFRGNEDADEAGEPTCLSIPFTPNLPRK